MCDTGIVGILAAGLRVCVITGHTPPCDHSMVSCGGALHSWGCGCRGWACLECLCVQGRARPCCACRLGVTWFCLLCECRGLLCWVCAASETQMMGRRLPCSWAWQLWGLMPLFTVAHPPTHPPTHTAPGTCSGVTSSTVSHNEHLTIVSVMAEAFLPSWACHRHHCPSRPPAGSCILINTVTQVQRVTLPGQGHTDLCVFSCTGQGRGGGKKVRGHSPTFSCLWLRA